MLLQGFKAGDNVAVTYNPMPYLGRGIQEPVVVEGVLQEPKVNRGVTYVILKDAEGKVLLERNVMEISTIGAVSGAPFSVRSSEEMKTQTKSYNRV